MALERCARGKTVRNHNGGFAPVCEESVSSMSSLSFFFFRFKFVQSTNE